MIARIVVVQTAFLGDVVLTTPLLRELKRVHPGAAVTVATTPLGRAVLEGHPHVDTLLVFDKKGEDRGLRGLARVASALARGAFDLAVAAQRSFRTGLLVRASRAPIRVGFAGAAGRWAYTHAVPWLADRHAVLRYLALAAPAGGDPERADPAPMLPVPASARERVRSRLAREGIGDGDRVLALAPGSVWGTKRWTPEGFAEVAAAAQARALRPVLVGSPEEAALCREVARLAGGVPVLAGDLSIPDLVAVLARASALVSNDSGPGHVAAAVGTPVVSLFGPTVPAFGYTPWGPSHRIVEHPDLACRPCDRHGPQVCPLGHHRCMREIGSARVVAALGEALV